MSTATRRLMKEHKKLEASPVENILVIPSQSNMHNWYFMLHSLDGDYSGGYYIGKIIFPTNYPFSPPDIIFLTPNGRFQTNTKICLSFTSFHPESWNPSWSMQNMLLGLISFMYENSPTTGGLSTGGSKKRSLARESISFNLRTTECSSIFSLALDRLGLDISSLSSTPSTSKAVSAHSHRIFNPFIILVFLVLAVVAAFLM